MNVRFLAGWALAMHAALAGSATMAGPGPRTPGSSRTAIYSRNTAPDGAIWWLDLATGQDAFLTQGTRPRLSPDGRYLVFLRDNNALASHGNVYVRDLETGIETRVFAHQDYVVGAAFSADGSRVVFDYGCGLQSAKLDGSDVQTIFGGDCYADAPAINPVTGVIAFHNVALSALGLVNPDGASKHYLPGQEKDVSFPAWSPDGQWLAFAFGESFPSPTAPWNLHRMKPDGSERAPLTDLTGANEGFAYGATWSSDGQSLLAAGTVAGENGLFVVSLDPAVGLRRLPTSPGDPIEFAGAYLDALDRTPPVLACPERILSGCGTADGAVVEFSVSATDDHPGAVSVVCAPPSGSRFPVGVTVVECTASDANHNRAQCRFPVVVIDSSNLAPPVVSRIAPRVVAPDTPVVVDVHGLNLVEADQVFINGRPLEIPYAVYTGAEGLIRGRLPGLPEGTYDVEIRRCSGVNGVLLAGLTVSPAVPSIQSIDDADVLVSGGRITLRGTGFTPDTRVRIGFPAGAQDNELRHISVSADGTTLIGDAPPLPAGQLTGPRDLLAGNGAGQSTLRAGLNYLPETVETDAQILALRRLQRDSSEPARVSFQQGSAASINLRVKVPGATLEQRARGFAQGYRELFRHTNPNLDLALARLSEGPLSQVRFAQRHHGLHVFGAELVVSLVGDEVFGAAGGLSPSARLEAAAFPEVPKRGAAEAEGIARAVLRLPDASLSWPSRLEIFDPDLVAPPKAAPVAAPVSRVWRVQLQGAAKELFIDSDTGAVVYERPLVMQDTGLESFYLEIEDAENEANSSSDWCFSLSNDKYVGDEDALEPYYELNDVDAITVWNEARRTYLFFHDHYAWHGYDEDESTLDVFIHSNHANAAWNNNCETMEFRTGWVDNEVLTHEYTHAIIGSDDGSQLEYKYEPGALNESYADLMALAEDRERGDLNWTHAENRTGFPGQPTRDIQNPSASSYPQPEIYANYILLPATDKPEDDNGGVHFNSDCTKIPSGPARQLRIGTAATHAPGRRFHLGASTPMDWVFPFQTPESGEVTHRQTGATPLSCSSHHSRALRWRSDRLSSA